MKNNLFTLSMNVYNLQSKLKKIAVEIQTLKNSKEVKEKIKEFETLFKFFSNLQDKIMKYLIEQRNKYLQTEECNISKNELFEKVYKFITNNKRKIKRNKGIEERLKEYCFFNFETLQFIKHIG